MSCDLELVESLAYGELSRDEKALVASHVAGCPMCSRELSLLQAERSLFASPRDPEPLPDIAVVLAASRSAPRRRFRPWYAFSAVAAAACFALMLGVRLRHPSPETDLTADTPPVLACYEGEPEAAETEAYALRDAIAGVERDYEACLVAMPSYPARERIEGREPSHVTHALFTPLPIEACE